MEVKALFWTLTILFGIIFAVLYMLKSTGSNKTMKVKKNSINTKDNKEDDWWRKELGIQDIEETQEKIESEENHTNIINETDTISADRLISKIKRLKTLYKKGTLTKTEFEKAKNKLLK